MSTGDIATASRWGCPLNYTSGRLGNFLEVQIFKVSMWDHPQQPTGLVHAQKQIWSNFSFVCNGEGIVLGIVWVFVF